MGGAGKRRAKAASSDEGSPKATPATKPIKADDEPHFPALKLDPAQVQAATPPRSSSSGTVSGGLSPSPFSNSRFGAYNQHSPVASPSPAQQSASRMSAVTKLDSLQNEEMRTLLNAVDELRHAGLNGLLSLPQLVVCGDQSSGKSSVLEAITQIPFPRASGLCTRFATEIILRREPRESMTAKVLPDETQNASRRASLQQFQRSAEGHTRLPEIIQDATKLIEAVYSQGPSRLNAFFGDILSITICGPSMSSLTLVDLPGLIHSENRQQTKQDVKFISELVEKYIANTRSIMLAVVSATHDYANQVILQKTRAVDSQGCRTLGIITKPDRLDSGSREERQWIDLALNNDVYLELGWHILRNRTQIESLTTSQDRDNTEKEFFSSRRSYQCVEKNILGIVALRDRLSRLLFDHIKREIPQLDQELTDELDQTVKSLDGLGHKKRTSMEEIKRFLMQSSMEYQRILQDAMNGKYIDPFFRTELSNDHPNPVKLRAAVQYHNACFGEYMHKSGANYNFKDVPSGVTHVLNQHRTTLDWQKDLQYGQVRTAEISREDAIKWVIDKMHQCRGEELPGMVGANLMKELYWEQTSRWESIATRHMKEMLVPSIHGFARGLLNHVMPMDVADRVWVQKVEPGLASQLREAMAELERIVQDKSGAPMTYNHYFTDTIQHIRKAKLVAQARRIVDKHTTVNNGNPHSRKKLVDADALLDDLENNLVEPDMNRFTAEDALDCLTALYKDKLKVFIAEVTEQVIERHLVKPLAKSTISPLTLLDLTDDQIRSLAAEPGHVTQERERLLAVKASLEKGRDALQRAMITSN